MDGCVVDFWLLRPFEWFITGITLSIRAGYCGVFILSGDPWVTGLSCEFIIVWGPCLLCIALGLAKPGKFNLVQVLVCFIAFLGFRQYGLVQVATVGWVCCDLVLPIAFKWGRVGGTRFTGTLGKKV